MKSFEGYLKEKLGNDYVLLAGGSHKALSDFSLSTHTHTAIYNNLDIFPAPGGNYGDGIRIHSRDTNNDWCSITFCASDNTGIGASGITANSWYLGVAGGNFYLGKGATGMGNEHHLRSVSEAWECSGSWTLIGKITGKSKIYTPLHIGIGEDLSSWDDNRAELDVITHGNNACDIWLGTNATREWVLTARPNGDIYLNNNHSDVSSNTPLYISKTGNVGIGAYSSSYRFNVNGSAYFGNASNSSGYNNVITLYHNVYPSQTSENIAHNGEAAWGISFDRGWSSYNSTNSAGIYAYGGGTWSTGLIFRVKNTSGGYNSGHNLTALDLMENGTVKAPYGFSGNLTGNVTGNVKSMYVNVGDNTLSTYTTSRAEVDIVSYANDAMDLWIGANNTRTWNFSARGSDESYQLHLYTYINNPLFYIYGKVQARDGFVGNLTGDVTGSSTSSTYSTAWQRTWLRGHDLLADTIAYHNETRVYMYDSDTTNTPSGGAGYAISHTWDWGNGTSLLVQTFDDGDRGRLYTNVRPCGNGQSWLGWRKVAYVNEIPTVTNYYWANVKISASSLTNTSPTFNHVAIGHNLSSYSSDRAELDVVSSGANTPCDIWLGSNGTRCYYISCRGANESYNLLFGRTYGSGICKFEYNLYAPNYYTTSDRSKKQNISSFSEHVRKFQLKDTEKWYYGVIALEVPEMFRDGEEGNMTVNYNSVLSYYIGSLENSVAVLEDAKRELENKINLLELKIKYLENK